MSMRSRTDAIVVHCTATPFGKHETIESLRAEHIARGFSDIGYHYVIGLNGEDWQGRKPEGCQGAHVRYFNDTTMGVAYVGGLGKDKTIRYPEGLHIDTRTPEQTATLIHRLKALLVIHPHAVILGHRDLSPDLNKDGVIEPNEYMKDCPCFDAPSWAKSVGLPGARYSFGKYVRL